MYEQVALCLTRAVAKTCRAAASQILRFCLLLLLLFVAVVAHSSLTQRGRRVRRRPTRAGSGFSRWGSACGQRLGQHLGQHLGQRCQPSAAAAAAAAASRGWCCCLLQRIRCAQPAPPQPYILRCVPRSLSSSSPLTQALQSVPYPQTRRTPPIARAGQSPTCQLPNRQTAHCPPSPSVPAERHATGQQTRTCVKPLLHHRASDTRPLPKPTNQIRLLTRPLPAIHNAHWHYSRHRVGKPLPVHQTLPAREVFD
jgi:hypothetical protein